MTGQAAAAPKAAPIFDTDELVINMGPQHPSTHGVLRVVLRLDGERVVDADVVIGYIHRGIEKLSENRDWTQIILLTDRMDYVAAATNNLGYCETVEKLMEIEVPRRARYIRTVLAELQRIASHCLWLGTHAMDIGAMTSSTRSASASSSSISSRTTAGPGSPTTPCASAGFPWIFPPAGTARSGRSATSWRGRSPSTKSC